MKKETFLKGAFILGMAGLVVKVLGAFFRIPLGIIIGSEGLGYYQVGYPIFTLLLSFSTQGFPTAISKLVSEKRAKGNPGGAHKVFRTSFSILLGLGVIGSLTLGFGAHYLVTKVVQSPNAYYAVLALAPALFFVPLLAAFRGYFQGMKNMAPTAISQVVEQAGRVILGLTLAVVLLNRGVHYAAAGAAFGATIGGVFGLSVISIIYLRHKKRILAQFDRLPDEQEEPTRGIIKDLVTIAVPITIGGAVMPLINIVDTMIVLRRLQAIGFTYEEANSLFGQLTGMAATLVNLPQVLTVALAMSMVPVISESKTRGDYDTIRADTQSAMRVSIMIGLPAAIGLAVLSGPIMQLLFPNEPASVGEILFFLSLAVLFLTQLQTLTGVLQGLGKPFIPVRNLMIGAGTKLVVTYVLTGVPALNVRGAAIGTVVAYLVAAVLNFIDVKKYTGTKFDLYQTFVKPIVAVIFMGVTVGVTYAQLSGIIGNSLATISAIGIGAVIYGGILLKTDAITQDDFDLLPGGGKISKVLKKAGLMK
ncbi:polysaccharide biosynthesis protein [Alkaliphilus metalliredigens QYMF]|uniref:Polysaccharide biosynthesis protein n=1 Tax=Alkaliphilus metalliredigens (strain QYMF) TaxID=293826 RepID=A6TJN2_ALKMQ|nr:polysaccharide biosynthesis protein [Alkaliphilus metalliredigens]ABR46400.1 polysaccharide biosynthesis protein [Alkaliphilus metalliredigens QYMF]